MGTYCNDQFVELESFFRIFHARAVSRTESFGSLVNLLPGEKVSLEESWELYDGLDQPFLPETV